MYGKINIHMYIPNHLLFTLQTATIVLPCFILSKPKNTLNTFLFFFVPVKPCSCMPTHHQRCLHQWLSWRWQEPLSSGLAPILSLWDIIQQNLLCWEGKGHDGDSDWGTLIQRQSSLILLPPFWCVHTHHHVLHITMFYQSAPKKCVDGGGTYCHLLSSVFQALPVPRTTNSRFGYRKCLVGIRALAQSRSSQGSIGGKMVVAFLSLSYSHMYTDGTK